MGLAGTLGLVLGGSHDAHERGGSWVVSGGGGGRTGLAWNERAGMLYNVMIPSTRVAFA